jgi:class 3 adenylate cyclase
MESVVTILYARVRNVLPVCNAMPRSLSAGFADDLRNILEAPVAQERGIVAQRRPDSILAIFGNDPAEKPDHARRALNAAMLAVCEVGALNQRITDHVADAPRLALAAGVHLGEAEVAPSPRGTSGQVRVTGEAVEVARLLECTAPDVGWSIVASGRARRAAGTRIEAGRFGSVALPDDSFIDIAEVTGLADAVARGAPKPYRNVKEAIAQNQKAYERSLDLSGAASEAARNAALHFSIEGYRIQRKIGEGGMASIYLATGPSDDLQVLKVMRIVAGEQGDPLQRFIQEFALLAQAKHPNVARIYRQGFCAGHAYIAMEYFSAGDLRARIARGGMGAGQALSYLKQTAAALQAIHAAGIVHRDLKPDNLMLRKDGTLALGDFGIAKHVAMALTDTAHDEVVGTPYYLSPEQATGRPVDQRCDLYSLGIIFYEMLTGEKPYRAQSAEAMLDLHIGAPVPKLPAPHERLQPLLERLMAKDCDKRYPSAAALLADLTKVKT